MRMPRSKHKEEEIPMSSSRSSAILLCCFFTIIISAGLVAVYSVHKGAAFLERHDAPARPELSLNRRSLSRQTGADSEKAGMSVSMDDLAVAVVTDQGHEAYVTYSRPWREGIQSYIGTNHTLDKWLCKYNQEIYNETWGYYPDDKPLHTLALKGDSRAALAPFLAFRELGESFKWLLYGDDDTLFFTDAALKIVKNLDPHMPYFLTDHMWWTEKWADENGNPKDETHHPHKSAPLCVPCNYGKDTSGLPFPSPKGCPCSTSTLCAADKKGIFFKGPAQQCGMPRVPIRTFSMHGGAGAVISVGLLKAIPYRQFEDCVTTTYSTGGDAVISICLWQVGFGMTNPDPTWHPKGLHMFDVGGEAQNDHDEIISRVARPMGNLLQAAAGYCTEGNCKLELDHLVTLHMRSRKFPSKACFAEIARLLAVLGRMASGAQSYTEVTTKGKKEEIMDQELKKSIEAYKDWRICQHTFKHASM